MNDAAMEFLLNRQSHPAKMLEAPVPEGAALERILTAGLRVPDHGKLEPWRLIVLARPALARLADLAEARARAQGLEGTALDERIAKGRGQFDASPLCVAVVSAPVEMPKVPRIEQVQSAAAVCISLVNAALASGFGAAWITGWTAFDRPFVTEGLGLGTGEDLAGFVHIGTRRGVTPARPRPDLAAKVTWVKS